jgi:hypothetical protein
VLSFLQDATPKSSVSVPSCRCQVQLVLHLLTPVSGEQCRLCSSACNWHSTPITQLSMQLAQHTNYAAQHATGTAHQFMPRKFCKGADK